MVPAVWAYNLARFDSVSPSSIPLISESWRRCDSVFPCVAIVAAECWARDGKVMPPGSIPKPVGVGSCRAYGPVVVGDIPVKVPGEFHVVDKVEGDSPGEVSSLMERPVDVGPTVEAECGIRSRSSGTFLR